MDKHLRLRVEEFVPRQVLSRLMNGELPSPPFMDVLECVVLFLDLSGFTKLTEQLAQQGDRGLEKMAFFLNRYFEQIVKLLNKSGGDIFKFAGDAALVLWTLDDAEKEKQEEEDPMTVLAHRAAQCAFELQAVLNDAELADGVSFSIKVGIGRGTSYILHVGGTYDRLEYLVAGPALGEAIMCEGQCSPGDIVVSSSLWSLLGQGSGRFEGREERPSSADSSSHGHGGNNPHLRYVKLLKMKERVKDVSVKRVESIDTHALKKILSRYAPAAIKQYMASYATWLPELRTVSVAFLNLGFGTSMFQGEVTPESLNLLQEVFKVVQRETYRHEGSINKFLLDDKGSTALIAFGLPPLSHSNDASRAVSACLDIVVALKSQLQYRNRCYMGVTTGRVFCGPMGGGSRREYTMLGDLVNTAARLMQSAKQHSSSMVQTEVYCGYILCDAETRTRASQSISSVTSELVFRAAGTLKLKGKIEALQVFQPGWIQHFERAERMQFPKEVIMATASMTSMIQNNAQHQYMNVVRFGLETLAMNALFAFDRFSVSHKQQSAVYFVFSEPGPGGMFLVDRFCQTIVSDFNLHLKRFPGPAVDKVGGVWMCEDSGPPLDPVFANKNMLRSSTAGSIQLLKDRHTPVLLVRAEAHLSRHTFPVLSVWSHILFTVLRAFSLGDSLMNELNKYKCIAAGHLERNILVDFENITGGTDEKYANDEEAMKRACEIFKMAAEKALVERGTIVICIDNSEWLNPIEWKFSNMLLEAVPNGLFLLHSTLPMHQLAYFPSFSKGPSLGYTKLLWRLNSHSQCVSVLHITKVEEVLLRFFLCPAVSPALLECVWLLTGGKVGLISACLKVISQKSLVQISQEGLADWQDGIDFDTFIEGCKSVFGEESLVPVAFDKLTVNDQVFLKVAGILARGPGVFGVYFDYGTLVAVLSNVIREEQFLLPRNDEDTENFLPEIEISKEVMQEFETTATKLQMEGMICISNTVEESFQECASVGVRVDEQELLVRKIFYFPSIALREAIIERMLFSKRKQIHTSAIKVLQVLLSKSETNPNFSETRDSIRRSLIYHLINVDDLAEASKHQRKLNRTFTHRPSLDGSLFSNDDINSPNGSVVYRKQRGTSMTLFQSQSGSTEKTLLPNVRALNMSVTPTPLIMLNRDVMKRSLAVIDIIATNGDEVFNHPNTDLYQISSEFQEGKESSKSMNPLGVLLSFLQRKFVQLKWVVFPSTSKGPKYKISPSEITEPDDRFRRSKIDNTGLSATQKESLGLMSNLQRSNYNSSQHSTKLAAAPAGDFASYEAELVAAHHAYSGRFSSFSQEDIVRIVDEFDIWDFNIFQLETVCKRMPLFTVIQLVFAQYPGVVDPLSPNLLAEFAHKLERSFNSMAPFHNNLYAACSLHACYVLIRAIGWKVTLEEPAKNHFSREEILSLLLASAIHPLGANCVAMSKLDKVASSVLEDGLTEKAMKIATPLIENLLSPISPAFAMKITHRVEQLLLSSSNISKSRAFLAAQSSEKISPAKCERELILELVLECALLAPTAKGMQLHIDWVRRFSLQWEPGTLVVHSQEFDHQYQTPGTAVYRLLSEMFPTSTSFYQAVLRNAEFDRLNS